MDSTISPQTRLTVSVGSRIPPELVDAIIDASKDDKSFLKICGLVCRTWVPASRRRLFEHVTLNDHNLAEFARLVESHLVTIPRHVRQLDIRQLSYQNVLDNTRVSSRLTFVKDLLLSQIDFTGHVVSLEHGFRSFRSLTRLRIYHCDFDSFNDLVNIFRSCAMLEHLSLVDITWCPTPESVPVAGSLPSLRQLVIQFVSIPEDVIAWFLSMQPVPALFSFTFHDDRWTEPQVQLLNTLLQTLGLSLQHLDVDDVETLRSSTSLNLSHNTDLQSLAFGLALPYFAPDAITSFLGPVSSSIRDMVFNTSILEEAEPEDIKDLQELEELDQFFCQPQFPQLQAIRFRIHESDQDGEIEKEIRLNMIGCLSRGLLSISNSTP